MIIYRIYPKPSFLSITGDASNNSNVSATTRRAAATTVDPKKPSPLRNKVNSFAGCEYKPHVDATAVVYERFIVLVVPRGRSSSMHILYVCAASSNFVPPAKEQTNTCVSTTTYRTAPLRNLPLLPGANTTLKHRLLYLSRSVLSHPGPPGLPGAVAGGGPRGPPQGLRRPTGYPRGTYTLHMIGSTAVRR